MKIKGYNDEHGQPLQLQVLRILERHTVVLCLRIGQRKWAAAYIKRTTRENEFMGNDFERGGHYKILKKKITSIMKSNTAAAVRHKLAHAYIL